MGNDEFNDHDDINTTNISDFLFSSPKKQLSNISQTIKQQPRIYPKTISRLLASSPAHQNQYRLCRGIGQTVTSTTTTPAMTTVSSSGSPCLSPIRYSIEINQSQSMNNEENIISVPTDQTSLPIDDSSLKVSSIDKMNIFKYSFIVYLSCSKLFKWSNIK